MSLLFDFINDPFGDMFAFERRLDRLFRPFSPAVLDFTRDAPAEDGEATECCGDPSACTRNECSAVANHTQRAAAFHPSFEVQDTDTELILHASLPGATEADLNVTVEDGVLTVSGEREATKEERRDNGLVYTSRSRSSFSRSFALPAKVSADQVTASFDGGKLVVRVPKPPAAQAHKIAVNAAASAEVPKLPEAPEHSEVSDA